MIECGLFCILFLQVASSQDHHTQSIKETLDGYFKKITKRSSHSFWSSLGNADKSTSEQLIYKLINPLCLITCIKIKPFKAIFQR